VHALAEAPLEGVLRLWSGLGYYRRARMLHAAAGDIVKERGGRFPQSSAELLSLRGVGRYTAGAVASIAWGEPVPVVDGNVARVLSRLFGEDVDVGSAKGKERIWGLAASLVAARDPSSWNQALMELGATTCSPRAPRCEACPVRVECAADAKGLSATLPRPRVKRPPRPHPCLGFVLRSGQKVLLARRMPAGLYGGMWEPPHVEDTGDDDLRAWVERAGTKLRRVGVVRHVLSHRRIDMTVHGGRGSSAFVARLRRSEAYDAFAWVAVDELETRPLTSLARKVLRAAGVGAERAREPRFGAGAPNRT
jgi:A/G-specific adenine glycosylase